MTDRDHGAAVPFELRAIDAEQVGQLFGCTARVRNVADSDGRPLRRISARHLSPRFRMLPIPESVA